MNCTYCKYNDGMVYTSNPPQYRCLVTGEYHFAIDDCNVEFEPVRHGRWIEEGLVDGNQNRYCRCSECGKSDIQAISQRVPYCWWCGAKMDGVEEQLKTAKQGGRRMNEFEVGEYIIYVNGEKYELGRITSLKADGAFVCYHEGETAAMTPYHTMHKLINRYCISKTTLGEDRFNNELTTGQEKANEGVNKRGD